MTPLSISMLTICGISELPDEGPRSATHVLSILDPEHPDPEAFQAYESPHRTVLRFHDIIEARPGMIPPKPEHVAAVLEFGEKLAESRPARAEAHLLVHCHMGISRSTAAMVTLLAQAYPDESEDRLMERLAEIRPQAWPNSLMIQFADEFLSRRGRLTEALRRHYGRQIGRDPRFTQWMRDIGRGREVDMAA
jgi:predicted protein tyrosine phosphatase